MNKPSFEKPLEQLFLKLDSVQANTNHPLFKSFVDKERYETQLMFAVRKRQAAKYHSDNVEAALESESIAAKTHAEFSAQSFKGKGAKGYFAMSVSGQSHHYVHELSAFLAALRSGLDFLTMAASRSMPGVKAYSVHTLMKMVEKGQTGPVLGVVKKHGAWLDQLKDYRDEVIHHLVVQSPDAGWTISHKGKTSITILPVVVPAATPKFAPDTRRSRMMDVDVPGGLMREESLATVTYEDGKEEVVDHSVTFSATSGYVPIEDFMSGHLGRYDSFLKDMFGVLKDNGWQQLKGGGE